MGKRKKKNKKGKKSAASNQRAVNAPGPAPGTSAPSPVPSDTSSSSEEERETPPKWDGKMGKGVVPLILERAGNWSDITTYKKQNNIQFLAGVKNIGLKMDFPTVDDYAKMLEFAKSRDLQYHTFPLPEELKLRFVVKDFPIAISVEDASTSIASKGYNPVKVMRLTNKTRKDIPVLLVVLPNDSKSKGFYKEEEIAGQKVIIEKQLYSVYIPQCHRCQKFGHTQKYCRRTPRCLKCAEQHLTYTCQKTKETPAKCANCGGDHPASYSGCVAFPEFIKKLRVKNK